MYIIDLLRKRLVRVYRNSVFITMKEMSSPFMAFWAQNDYFIVRILRGGTSGRVLLLITVTCCIRIKLILNAKLRWKLKSIIYVYVNRNVCGAGLLDVMVVSIFFIHPNECLDVCGVFSACDKLHL